MLYVIEGLDGSGKNTQANLLLEYLHNNGKEAEMVSFPCYSSPSSTLVKMYLNGEFGSKADDVNAYAASTFFAVDRVAHTRNWDKDKIIIADRYTSSNAVYQCSKLDKSEWDEFLDWLFDFEYSKLGIPAPDKTVFLYVDPKISQKLMAARYKDDESKKDIHERDLEYLNRTKEAGLYCCKKLGWTFIDCCENGNILPVEVIHEKIKEALF